MTEALSKNLTPGQPWDTCKECGYDGGFHLAPNLSVGEGGAQAVEMLLKCPSCKRVYDAGLVANTKAGVTR